jgi:hypothetical protein
MQVSRCYQKQRLGQTKDAGKSSTLSLINSMPPVSEKQEEKPKRKKNTHTHTH